MKFLASIKNICLQKHLVQRGDRILVGVSGGPDSVALIHALYALRHDLGLQLFIAHLNHGLRRQAVKEQIYVKEISRSLNLPLFTKTIDLHSQKGSLEEASREARFRFLVDTAKRIQAQSIALGHHRDDLAETTLMRILRGAGPQGMQCILFKRKINGEVFVRPLLDVTRDEIMGFLKQNKIKFYIDVSNRNTDFFRNKIRLELLPLLEKEYNPNIKEVLVHFSQSVSLTYDYLKTRSNEALGRSAVGKDISKDVSLDTKKILSMHPALLREMIRISIKQKLGHTRSFSFSHIESIEQLIKSENKNAVVHLPYDLSAIKKGAHIIFQTSKRRPLIKKKNTL